MNLMVKKNREKYWKIKNAPSIYDEKKEKKEKVYIKNENNTFRRRYKKFWKILLIT